MTYHRSKTGRLQSRKEHHRADQQPKNLLWEICDSIWKNQVFFNFLRKFGFSRLDKYKKEKNGMQKIELHYLKQMWFCLHLANLILAWKSTKSAPLNGHYPKLQCPTYTCFSLMALSTVFYSINSSDNSPFSHSVLPVLSLPYWSIQLYFSLCKFPSALMLALM